jgi:hypothetical protein
MQPNIFLARINSKLDFIRRPPRDRWLGSGLARGFEPENALTPCLGR